MPIHGRKPRPVLALAILLILVPALAAPAGADRGRERRETPFYEQQVAATRLTQACFAAVKEYRLAQGLPLDPRSDPNETGLIGWPFSAITTCIGMLGAKRTTTNPNFAALFVRYFKQLSLERGDTIAIGTTGSFPGLVIATLASARVLGLEPILIYSVGTSQYGANIPRFTLVEMLDCLNSRGLLPYKPAAVSLEISAGCGRVGLFRREPEPFREILAHAGVPVLISSSLTESIRWSREVYRRAAAGRPIRCFVNLGAGWAFAGDLATLLNLPDGLIASLPVTARQRERALLLDYAAQGIPVISFIRIRNAAARAGVAVDPVPMEPVGTGDVYYIT